MNTRNLHRFIRVPLYLSLAFFAGCHKPVSNADLLNRLPSQDAIVVGIDVQTLRGAGILKLLAANKTVEEPEYQAFIKNSGFDYQRDLDSALAAFAPSGTFFLVRGRFDWKKLETYAQSNGGSCYDKLCRMPGSKPERRISFLPLENNLMALAVSSDDLAASRLTKAGPQRDLRIPAQPLWISIPAVSLQPAAALPGAAQVFARALSGADGLMLTLGPHGEDYEVRLEAVCKSLADAKSLSGQLTGLTSMLGGFAKPKSPDDLAALLAAGSFSTSDRKVFGYWPVRKTLIQTLAGM